MNSEDDLKKLMMHSLLTTDLEEKSVRPMSPKEERATLNTFSEPDFSDSMSLCLIKENFEPGKLFSKKSLEKFLFMIRLFVGGRILGHFDKTKKEPEVVRVRIIVEHMPRKEYDDYMKD